MSETVQFPETETLKVTVHDPSKVDLKDFKFKTAKQLDKRLKRAERILSFDDPEYPDEPINVHLRALTSNEEAILHQSNYRKMMFSRWCLYFLKRLRKVRNWKLPILPTLLRINLLTTTMARLNGSIGEFRWRSSNRRV